MTRVLVVCADGATPASARAGGCFADGDEPPLQPLRSIYPASTAPAHASMLTGRPASEHGVVGNRYWEDEPVALIRASQDPLAALHPYDHDTLRCPSLLAALHARGHSTAAVMFPGTFSRRDGAGADAAAFCLYLPTSHCAVGEDLRVTGLGFDLRLGTAPAHDGATLTAPDGGRRWSVRRGAPADVTHHAGRWGLSFRVALGGDGRLVRSTAVGLLATGAAALEPLLDGVPPAHSLVPAYTAAGETDYFEAPAAAWVTRAALTLAGREPDVLFVRYNQIDHAQEHLHWYAVNGEPGVREAAREQILETYRDVEREIGALRAALGPEVPTLLFSDHGITDVSRQLDPDAVLAELGLQDELVFQGDSHLGFVYGDRPVSADERAALLRALGGVEALDEPELARRAVLAPGRCGRLALATPPGAAFAYSGRVADEPVRRATHGFAPALPEMHGLVRLLGPWPAQPQPQPASLLDLAALVATAAGG